MPPNAAQLAALERGDFIHAGGNAKCERCEAIYFDHPVLDLAGRGEGWFAVACDGRLLKL